VASQQKSSPTPPTPIPGGILTNSTGVHTSSSTTTTSVTAVSTSASIAAAAAAVTSGSTSSLASNASLSGDSERHERRPSWRLRLDANDKTKFRLEEDTIAATSRGNNKNQNNALTALARKGSKYESTRSDLTSPTIPEHSEVPSVTITSSSNNTATTSTSASASASTSSSSTLQPSNHRRKKPKRRSTGVVNLDVDDVDPDGESAEEESSSVPNTTDNPGNSSAHPPHHHHQHHHQSGHDNNKNNNNPTAATAATTNRSGSTDRSQNGEIDYRKLWEQSQLDNSKLRDDLARTRDELTTAKKKLDTVVQSPQPSSGLSDTEKKEKQALEKKLAEMEEELKQLEHLKNDNQRLRDENGALIRVISKLSK